VGCPVLPVRYVTPGAFIEAAEEFGIPREVAMRNWEGCIQARAALYLPGGRIAKELSRNPTVLVVNETAFAHGGLLPTHGKQTLMRPAAGLWLMVASYCDLVISRMDCRQLLLRSLARQVAVQDDAMQAPWPCAVKAAAAV
jgi:hypothetical protein